MAIRAVLLDVGGPLDTEVMREQLIDRHIQDALRAEGIAIDDDDYHAAGRWAVESFAPDTYRAIIWRLAASDANCATRVYRAVAARAPERQIFELREGMAPLLARLHARGLRLGLATNGPAHMLTTLDAAGIGRYFQHREVAGIHGLRKPDVRLFLRACEDLEVTPDACLMVGDRVDNDIVPARLLGMRAVLFRTGRHVAQQPRTWDERPDVEVRDVEGLIGALAQFGLL